MNAFQLLLEMNGRRCNRCRQPRPKDSLSARVRRSGLKPAAEAGPFNVHNYELVCTTCDGTKPDWLMEAAKGQEAFEQLFEKKKNLRDADMAPVRKQQQRRQKTVSGRLCDRM